MSYSPVPPTRYLSYQPKSVRPNLPPTYEASPSVSFEPLEQQCMSEEYALRNDRITAQQYHIPDYLFKTYSTLRSLVCNRQVQQAIAQRPDIEQTIRIYLAATKVEAKELFEAAVRSGRKFTNAMQESGSSIRIEDTQAGSRMEKLNEEMNLVLAYFLQKMRDLGI